MTRNYNVRPKATFLTNIYNCKFMYIMSKQFVGRHKYEEWPRFMFGRMCRLLHVCGRFLAGDGILDNILVVPTSLCI